MHNTKEPTSHMHCRTYDMVNITYRWMMVVICLGLMGVSLSAQCVLSEATPIPDDDVVVLGFSISGLTDDDMASPTQGICGVHLNFNHEYLGDLTIVLISPSGQMDTLIGPATVSTGGTNLTSWNVQFVPCGMPAAPDAGFTDAWSNEQGWASLAFYNGTYYPYEGCLEDFNVGSANGLWQLYITDDGQNQIGNLLSATLEFCNPAGLSCASCDANGGTLSPVSITACAGDQLSSTDIMLSYGLPGPPSTEYLYEYIVTTGNTILAYSPTFFTIPPVGNYKVCGLSFAEADTLLVHTVMSSGQYDVLMDLVLDGEVCGQFSSNCVDVSVLPRPDTTHIANNLCAGESFTFRGQTYTTIGTFYQVQATPGSCDSVFEIRLTPRPLAVTIPPHGILSCGGSDVSLGSQVMGAMGPFMYQWTTGFGNITSASNLSTITVNQPAQYSLSVTDGICSGNAATTVMSSAGYPQVFVDPATINCNNPVVTLHPIFVPTTASVQWTGPMGFMSNQATISVSVPGLYFLTVTNAMGCSTTKSVMVNQDFNIGNIVIYTSPKDCPGMGMHLNIATSVPINIFDWTGPNGFLSDSYSPLITAPGVYNVTTTFSNGCQESASFVFDGDFTIPDLIVPPADTLNCNETITLTSSSSIPGVTYNWSGPQSFSSDQAQIMTDQAGIYTIEVTAPNGCTASGDVEVANGLDIFSFQTYTDTITCVHDSAVIGVLSQDADVFDWQNYSGPGDSTASITVGQPGIYTVFMTDTSSGCQIKAKISVVLNKAIPSFSFVADTITCADPIAELSFVPSGSTVYSGVFWELPDFTIVQGQTLISDQPGDYMLHAVGKNGCIGTKTVTVPADTLKPFLLLESDTLTCRDTAMVLAQAIDPVIQFVWSGPGILTDLGDTLQVIAPGIYHLEATGENECVSAFDVMVDSNFVAPAYIIDVDPLVCAHPDTLSVSVSNGPVTYAWYDSSGNLISQDSFIEVTFPGTYSVEIEAKNRCLSTDTVVLDAPGFPVISFTNDTITCSEPVVMIEASTDIPLADMYWLSANGDTLSWTNEVMTGDANQKIYYAVATNGCVNKDSINVPVDTIPPVAVIDLIGEIRCQSRDVVLDGGASSPFPLAFQWSTTGGQLLGDLTQSMVNAHDTGYYSLLIQRLDNGCMDTEILHLLPVPDEIIGATLNIVQPACTDDVNGSFGVSNVFGGAPPFTYQINIGPPQSDSTFEGLAAGMYSLTISDGKGCAYDTLAEIIPSPDYTVEAGEEIEIYLGETAMLNGSTTLITDQISDQFWDTAGTVICHACPSLDVIPFETTIYQFSVLSETGCLISDQVTVYVIGEGQYTIPNIFSPNGDGINDEIRLFAGPGLEKVLKWVIFDRWGNAVFGKENFDPGDPSVAWDGRTSTGEFANPAVFPYVLEYQLINGRVETKHGNITLVR